MNARRSVGAHRIYLFYLKFIHGGDTKLENLVLLCRRHHRLVLEQGFTVTNAAAGFHFYPPP